MTKQEVTETIERVASRYAYKFQFAYYTPEDIKQEAFLIAMEALDRYDSSRPLENFLAVHIKNRLNNFKRDKFYRQTSSENINNNSKKYLMEPLDISNIRDEFEDNMKVDDDFISSIENKELLNLIDEHLEVTLRADYLRILHNVYVSKPRREQIYVEIKRILGEHDNEEG